MNLLDRPVTHISQSSSIIEGQELTDYLKQVNDWEVVKENLPMGCKGLIRKEIRFNDYEKTMEYANRIMQISEDLGHHPDMLVQWCLITISVYTHTVGGISPNDFVLAAHIDNI
jgi:4a-hydroxytetrahydrobiopterin dehydratase